LAFEVRLTSKGVAIGERSSNVGRRRQQISRDFNVPLHSCSVAARKQREGDGSGDLKGLHPFLAPAASLDQPCCRPSHGKHPHFEQPEDAGGRSITGRRPMRAPGESG
jgi:hypothetical protein